ncbi:hypothetical protein INT43_003876 [Umbelopsis isabellina]|uniref:Protein MEMO1 n=1 Tax=Mortierella isabellina TaxID=91625 RepID=A0A8H7PUH1_MORIS|nr:hypothetical protein INT43_003876 [Umbelopsis isabellina]
MIRSATHAGSWYSGNEAQLNHDLDKYLSRVPTITEDDRSYPIKGTKAIIAPHAGYSYSGPAAAYAYKCIDIDPIKRIFILGPSHHVYLDGCAVPKTKEYETPLGNLAVDTETIDELRQNRLFKTMSNSVDEEEHSIEMHLPYTYKMFESKIDDIKVVPIMVGSISSDKEKVYGEALAPYLSDPATLFIVSSDFCHWGSRFRYTYYRADETSEPIHLKSSTKSSEITTPIHKSISNLDHRGMEIIETLNHEDFAKYLRETDNTICGRHPIGVLLAALAVLRQNSQQKQQLKFVHYDQSSPCKTSKDSSTISNRNDSVK